MKTTLELPDELLKAVKLRAVHAGRRLEDEVADLIRAGLEAETMGGKAKVESDETTGLPVIRVRHGAKKGEFAERVAEILAEQEAEHVL